MIQGSRLLNDNGPVLGLNVYDLMAAIGLLLIGTEIFDHTAIEVASLVAPFLLLGILVPIRLKYRRKTVRDRIYYWARKLGYLGFCGFFEFRGGRIYVPTRYR